MQVMWPANVLEETLRNVILVLSDSPVLCRIRRPPVSAFRRRSP